MQNRQQAALNLVTTWTGQVEQTPTKIAVIYQAQQLSYAELNQRANQLAHHLQQQGLKPEQLVGLSISASLEMIVAILGILKAGGAFVPLDPHYPPDRLKFMIEDSGLKLIVTTAKEINQLVNQAVKLVCLNDLAADTPNTNPLLSAPSPQHLACCLYTSGSTGQPKGVLLEHQALTHHCLIMQAAYEYSATDKALLFASLNYVAALEQLFVPLFSGACLVIREPDLWTAASFPSKVRDYGLTVADLPPDYWHSLLESWQNTPQLLENLPLRLVIVGGDKTRPETVKLWQQSPLCTTRFLNAYGMTETPVTATLFEIPNVGDFQRVPIGLPTPNWHVYLLDAQLQPVLAGEEGEICIAGTGLARGYLNQPTLTDEKFVINPVDGKRMYRTGDLGRFLPDGNLEYLGRKDHQVQIRGFRVELGEIESALLTYPAVHEAAVITQGEAINKQLVAYVACDLEDSIWQLQGSYRHEAGIITDTSKRLEFKLQQANIQAFTGTEIALTKPVLDEAFVQNYLSRQSYRQFAQKKLPFESFCEFLSCLLQLNLADTPIPKYRYPSALGLYPVQTYLSVKAERIEGIKEGFYYYHPKEHRLVRLKEQVNLNDDVYGSYNRAISQQAAFSLFLVAHLEAIRPMYGQQLAEKFCLTEAGYMGQLLMTEAPTHQIGLCPSGDLAEFEPGAYAHQALGLTDNQWVIHGYLGGAIEPSQTKTWLQSSKTQQSEAELKTSLKNYLKEKLPAHSVPEHVILLAEIPKTPNGKIDRNALPALNKIVPAINNTFALAQTPLEQALSEIWQAVLEIELIGRHDNFFDLGGHSLLAIRLISQINQSLHSVISITDLFQSPTIAEMALIISRSTHEINSENSDAVIQTVSRTQDIPLSFRQKELWLDSRSHANHKMWSFSFLWKIIGKLDINALEKSFEKLAARHEILRTTFPVKNGQPIVKINPEITVRLLPTDISDKSEPEKAIETKQLLEQETQQPLDLLNGSLWRVKLIKLEQEVHYLHLYIHHIVMDAAAMEIFFHELFVLYEAQLLGQPSPLPALTIQYADFAYWQSQRYSQEKLQKQRDYYQQLLTPEPSSLNLPTDKPRPEEAGTFPVSVKKFQLTSELTRQLKELSKQSNTTFFISLFSALTALLYCYTNQEDIVIGSPMNRRFYQGTESLIGDFSGAILVRINTGSNPTFSELLKRTHHAVQSAIANQELTYGQVAEALGMEKPNVRPFRVLLNFLPTPLTEIKSFNITAVPVIDESEVKARLDLAMPIWEENGDKGAYFKGGFRYRSDLFEKDTISRMIENFTTLLKAMVANSKQPVKTIDLNL